MTSDFTPTTPFSATLRVGAKWDPTQLQQSPTQRAVDRAARVSPYAHRKCSTFPAPHIHSNTDMLCAHTHTHTQTLRPWTPLGARKQSHRSSETHRPRLMDTAWRSHTVGQGGTHKYIERCRDRDTKGHVYEGEARGTNAQKSCKHHTHSVTSGPLAKLQ